MDRFCFNLILAITTLICHAEPVPDFQLRDVNFNSPRGGQFVSPRDYRMQITAFYFGEASCSGCRTQFALLQTLQNELNAANPDLHVEIVGVNHPDHSSHNSLMIEGKTMSWLQDTVEQRVWESWNAGLRDVRILNPRNVLIENFNLVSFPLQVPGNAAVLKQKLSNAATAVDSDADRLLDAWEEENFGSLEPLSTADSDGDGMDNFHEFAFGTDPKDAASRAEIFKAVTAQDTFIFSFRRQAGSWINYFVEASTDLRTWDDSLDHFIFSGPPAPLFDGTGVAEVSGTLNQPLTEKQFQFIRVRAQPTSK